MNNLNYWSSRPRTLRIIVRIIRNVKIARIARIVTIHVTISEAPVTTMIAGPADLGQSG